MAHQYPNKRKSYCLSIFNENKPILYEGKKQYFRTKFFAYLSLKKIEKEFGRYLEIVDLRDVHNKTKKEVKS